MTRTWKIRDGMPDGTWGPERKVTLEQYRAELNANAERAKRIHAENVARLRAERRTVAS